MKRDNNGSLLRQRDYKRGGGVKRVKNGPSLSIPTQLRCREASAWTAAPTRPASGLRMIETGIVADEILHQPLGAERVEERPLPERGQDLRRDAAPDIDAARRDVPQGEVARFGPVRLDEHLQRVDALRAPFLQRGAADFRGQLGRVVDGPTPTHSRAGTTVLGVKEGADPNESWVNW